MNVTIEYLGNTISCSEYTDRQEGIYEDAIEMGRLINEAISGGRLDFACLALTQALLSYDMGRDNSDPLPCEAEYEAMMDAVADYLDSVMASRPRPTP